MIPLYYDLHIHSCLSPCGDADMTPSNIAGMAAVKNLDVIALTDHNSCRNCPAAIAAGERLGVTVIPGMELTTSEEIHVVFLFSSLEHALSFDSYVYEHLLPIKNRPEIFGSQLITDENDEVIGFLDKLLISATDIPFYETDKLASSFGGICFPAHLDKSSTSLISNLGSVPPDSTFCCAELKNVEHLHRLKKEHPYLERCRILSNSDAHYLWDIAEPNLQIYAKSKQPADILGALSSMPVNGA